MPDFYASNSVDYKVDIHDQNFNTFDGIQWTCSEDGNSLVEGNEGLAPVLYWQVWRDDFPTTGTNLLLDDGYQSATAPITWQAPKVNEDRTYRIAGWYECGGDVDFTDAANYEFDITRNGLLGSTNLIENCFIETFPFIDMGACINNIGVVINLLSFNTIGMSGNWNVADGCHSLVVLGNWMQAGSTTVCPNVPSTVRNIVTPFVTFALGLAVITFIAKRTGSEF